MKYSILLLVMLVGCGTSYHPGVDVARVHGFDDLKREFDATDDELIHAIATNPEVIPIGTTEIHWPSQYRYWIFGKHGFATIKERIESHEGRIFHLEHVKK